LLYTGWRFINHDIVLADIDQIDDSSWQTVSVPHDWAIAGPFDMIDLQAVQVMEDGDKR
jgi:beta-galactosidase